MRTDLARKDEIPQQFTSAEMTEIKNAISTETANVNIKPYHVYSPNEQVVGEWQEEISGVLKKKPVYEKTITDGYGGTGWAGEHDHNISNIDTIVSGFVTCTNSNYTFSGGFYSDGIGVGISLTPTKYEVFCNYSGLSTRTNIVKIQYTKTTDAWEEV